VTESERQSILHTHQVAVIVVRNSRRRQKLMKAFNVETGGGHAESDKASLGDRGHQRPEFDSPGEHSYSHTWALPLHIQYRSLPTQPALA
jgi:hypothetical protein